MEFPGMTMNELSPPVGEENHFEQTPVKDLDEFFTHFYQYYYEKGLGVILLTEICAMCSLGFTVLFTSFLIGVVNWPVLNECLDETTCQNVENELFLNPFHQEPSFARFIVTIYFLLFLSYWFYSIHKSIQKISRAWEMEDFYRDSLKIPFNSLSDYPWHEVLDRFLALYQQDNLPFLLFPSQKELELDSHHPLQPLLSQPSPGPTTHGHQQQHYKPTLTVQQIIYRIMRKENYFIALINKHQLDLSLPWWLSPYTTEQLILTKTLEWALSFCLFDEMFYLNPLDGTYLISNHFYEDIPGLQFRFQMIGLILFLLIPFLLVFMCFHFFLENASYFHSTKAYLGPRQWTPMAVWQFREFNELKHIFEQRMNQAYIPATEYLLSFRNHYLIVLAKLFSYLSGGIVATILLISLFYPEALLHITLWEHNLLWYLGVGSAIFATSRSLLPDETKKTVPPSQLLEQMISYTHQDGLPWRGKEHTTAVRNEVQELLAFKIHLFFVELAGVLLTPFILCFSLPRCVPTLLEFLRTHSEFVENVGTVCDYSLFNIEKHGDPDYGSFHEGARTTTSGEPDDHLGKIQKDIRLNDGKLEKSVMNFMQNYPTVQLGPATNHFLDRIDTYRSMIKTRHEREITSILENSLFPGGLPTDRVILPPARSSSMEDIHMMPVPTSPVTNQGFGVGSLKSPSSSSDDQLPPHHHHHQTIPSNLSFPAGVGGTDLLPSGDSSPVRTVVTSDYYPAVDQTTINNTLANKGGPPTIDVPTYPVEQLRQGSGGGGGPQRAGARSSNTATSILKSPNYSQYPSRRGNGTPHRFPPSSSSSSLLFGRSRGYHRHSHGTLNEEGDMPSVLLSLLKQQNIDYENDFYWLEKFHREKVLAREELEKSMIEYQQSLVLPSNTSATTAHMGGVGASQSITSSAFATNSSYPFAIAPGRTGIATAPLPNQIPHPGMKYSGGATGSGGRLASGSGGPASFSLSNDDPTFGMYAAHINQNVVSSPKLQSRQRKTVQQQSPGPPYPPVQSTSRGSLKSNNSSNPQMTIVHSTSTGMMPSFSRSGGEYFPFNTSTVQSMDEGEGGSRNLSRGGSDANEGLDSSINENDNVMK